MESAAPVTLGLFNNTLYEVLQDTGTGSVVVNATIFDVSCGAVEEKEFEGSPLGETMTWTSYVEDRTLYLHEFRKTLAKLLPDLTHLQRRVFYESKQLVV